MSNLRLAAGQALEALEKEPENFADWLRTMKAARSALRAALAEDAMQRLADEQQMIERGTKAWADVPDATAWVEELRGNEPVADCHGLEQARAAATSNLLAHFGITSANSDVNVAYLHKQLDDFLTAAIGCSKGGDKLAPPSDHIPDATKMIEPVAWITPGQDLHLVNYEGFQDWVPLYTAPPKRKPLTVEQLRDIKEHQRLLEELGPVWAPMLYYFCQAIERAHGIGGEE